MKITNCRFVTIVTYMDFVNTDCGDVRDTDFPIFAFQMLFLGVLDGLSVQFEIRSYGRNRHVRTQLNCSALESPCNTGVLACQKIERRHAIDIALMTRQSMHSDVEFKRFGPNW